MIWIYTDGRPSSAAFKLAKQAGFKRCKVGKVLKAQDIFVNWGAKDIHVGVFHHQKILNCPENVMKAANKLTAFEYMAEGGVQTVPWCRPANKLILDDWVAKGHIIVGRTSLTGHSGHGIIIMEKGSPIQPALLYTQYIFKEREFRVHVIGGEVIDTQQKIRDPHKEVFSWKIRSHENGFIFARNNISQSEKRDILAVAACNALGLDFGAVDIVEDKKGAFYVLEVNTAPGLEGQTITKYAEAFRKFAND